MNPLNQPAQDEIPTSLAADMDRSRRWILWGTAATVAVSAVVLRLMGQPLSCKCGLWTPWSWDIWSSHNSQHWIDPYTLTHVLHGVLLCGLLYWLPGSVPERVRYLTAMVLEAIWEIQENSPIIIERYRAVTISQDYFGDSVVNSVGDILACALGYWIAFHWRTRRSLIFFLVTEVVLAIWIRDNLTLNVVMLVFPSDTIQNWQMGGG